MLNIVMSRAASGLLRALLERSGDRRDRILLSEIRSVDWQSLTLTGERHEITLRVPGPDADAIVDNIVSGIEDAEFSIRGHLVADIIMSGAPTRALDGSVTLGFEALTIAD
ncbi:MAG TPA: hypothetical protein VEC14_10560 [Reyranellaceae bacterium]|nr:hypothetical protein [Reyranellaceae bacterium]